jgi:murein DD-endopeptidase MepM/ murein hydrolase activator NlpD
LVVATAVVGVAAAALGVSSVFPASAASSATTALSAKSGSGRISDSIAESSITDGSGTTSGRSSDTRASRSHSRTGVAEPQQQALWLLPADADISSLFAARWGTFHYGIDFAAAYGSTVHAASGGTVIRSGWYGGYGNIVIIDHGDGVTTRYGHNSKLLVSVGEHVDAGDPISQVGSTGDSTGPHCHFEVRIDDKPIDPLPFLEEHDVKIPTIDTNL